MGTCLFVFPSERVTGVSLREKVSRSLRDPWFILSLNVCDKKCFPEPLIQIAKTPYCTVGFFDLVKVELKIRLAFATAEQKHRRTECMYAIIIREMI